MKCSNCGNEIKEGAKFCTRCGAKQKEETKIKFCKECGSELDMDTLICPKCGFCMNEEKKKVKSNVALLGVIFGVVCSIVFIMVCVVRIWFEQHPTEKMKEEKINRALAAYEKMIESSRTENAILSSGHGKLVGVTLVNISDDGIPECIAWFDEYHESFNHISLERYAVLLDHNGSKDEEWASSKKLGALGNYQNFKYIPESGSFMCEVLDYYKVFSDDDNIRFKGHFFETYSFSDEEQEFECVDSAYEEVSEGLTYYRINGEDARYVEWKAYTDKMPLEFEICLSENDVYDSVEDAYDAFAE